MKGSQAFILQSVAYRSTRSRCLICFYSESTNPQQEQFSKQWDQVDYEPFRQGLILDEKGDQRRTAVAGNYYEWTNIFSVGLVRSSPQYLLVPCPHRCLQVLLCGDGRP